MEWVIGIWAIVILVPLLNLCAAGMAAILHVRRSKLRYGARVMTALAVTGLLPSSLFIVVGLASQFSSAYAGPPAAWVLWFAMVFSISAAAASPGAIIVTSKLEKPGDEFRAFE